MDKFLDQLRYPKQEPHHKPKCQDPSSTLKRDRDGEFPEIEEALFRWIRQANAMKFAINGNILKEKAILLALKMGQDNFEASNGWLEKFKARRNIAFKRLHGEAGSVDANSVATWKDMATAENSPAPPSKKGVTKEFTFGPWTITSTKSHILESKCSCEQDTKCHTCRYEQELGLPHLPDMTFPENLLRLTHQSGDCGVEFNTLDALRPVNSTQDLMKVAVAEAWKQARCLLLYMETPVSHPMVTNRSETENIREVVKPFDWTFTTDYSGTLLKEDLLKAKNAKSHPINSISEKVLALVQATIEETEDRIDMEKLKLKEQIVFYDEIHLFEDELADNGIAQCSVKVRVMQKSFFILLRFFLRVDNVLVRINDTRFYHEAEQSFILKEYTSRESKIEDLEIRSELLRDPVNLWMHVPVVKACYHKLEFPS
ncbi:TIPRL [Cordylochernes scorpioides]|uniref:TIP41-like protein n=1 Tax=Cordylochernes scorpioides TaxID=51811 RepID=A0ABY6KFZ3_9ARAC|nr:TIPRL [Cordylochernes scorpioides]